MENGGRNLRQILQIQNKFNQNYMNGNIQLEVNENVFL